MIFADDFYRIDQGEVFQKSSCMKHEQVLFEFLSSILTCRGYSPTQQHRVFVKGSDRVVVCFADDFGVCRQYPNAQPRQWFDANTIVITDNLANFQTQYQVKQVPTSYFGIFSYVPDNQQWNPTHRFNFAVNRLDSQRLLLLLELLTQSDASLATDAVNFNCWSPTGVNNHTEDVKNNLLMVWQQIKPLHERYETLITDLQNSVPIKNHDMTIEQAHVLAWVNMVVETYAGDHSIAFSEKIFRALVTPAPWTVFSALGAVNYLRQLGFDVLDDVVDHSYNQTQQNTSLHGIKKIQQYVSYNTKLHEQLQEQQFDKLQARCLQAAQHNQHILLTLKQQWPQDFAAWLPKLVLDLGQAKY